MNEITLTKSSVYFDFLPKISHVDNEYVKEYLLFLKDKKLPQNSIFGTPQDITWVLNYITDIFKLKHKFRLIPIKIAPFIYNKNIKPVKRNNINKKDVLNSPVFTFIYCVDTEDDVLVLHWEDYRNKNKFLEIPLENKKYIMWNSNLKYHIVPNKKDKKRTLMLIDCKIL